MALGIGKQQNLMPFSKQLACWFQGSFVRPVQWTMWYEQTRWQYMPLTSTGSLEARRSVLLAPSCIVQRRKNTRTERALTNPSINTGQTNMTGCSLSFWCNAARKCILRSRAESQTSHRRNYICSVSVLMLLMLLRVRQKTHTFSLMKLFGFCLQAFDDGSFPWCRY